MELTLDQALQKGIEAHKAGKVQEADRYYTAILKANPKHPDANHNMGVLAVGVSKVEEALPFFKTALEANPKIEQYWLSYIDALIKLDQLDDAKVVVEQAKSNGAKGDVFDQLGKKLGSSASKNSNNQEPSEDQQKSLINLCTQGHYQETLCQASQLLKEFPNSISLYNVIGSANQSLGKPDEAITNFKKALSIKPDYPAAHYNVGNALLSQGKQKAAIKAYKKVISIEPDHTGAHYNLSNIQKYTSNNAHFLQVQELYKRADLSKDDRCYLSFALARIYDKIGELDKAFKYLSEGNALRKKLLNYSMAQDNYLFSQLKRTQPKFFRNRLTLKVVSTGIRPIFILGMPRSGTTLLEQIISTHSKVCGAGELEFVKQFGFNLATGSASIDTAAILEFRERYLSALSKVSDGKYFVTDKMPQNFRFIPVICAAFPEVKIIHVKRNAAATCWSNYNQYFPLKSFGYCFDLKDVVSYYELYTELMNLWQLEYSDRIYHLNYESLTTDQENQTRKLIEHLGLDWENACLLPHKNKRGVRTASQQQVRQKVYKGSSEVWRKYEPYLKGAFDGLEGLTRSLSK